MTVLRAAITETSDQASLLRITDPGTAAMPSVGPLVVFGFKPEGLKEGDLVTVRGKFVFYDQQGYWEIKTARGDRQAVVLAAPVAPAGPTGPVGKE